MSGHTVSIDTNIIHENASSILTLKNHKNSAKNYPKIVKQVIQKVYRQVDPGTPQTLQKVRHRVQSCSDVTAQEPSKGSGTLRNLWGGLPAGVIGPYDHYLDLSDNLFY